MNGNRLENHGFTGKNPEMSLVITLALIIFIAGFLIAFLDPEKEGNSLLHGGPVLLLRRYFHLDSRLGWTFFCKVIPGFDRIKTEGDPDLILERRGMDFLIHLLLDIRYPSPQELLRVQLPVTAFYQQKNSTVPAVAGISRTSPAFRAGEVPERKPPAVPLPTPPKRIEPEPEPQVLIFHTHTSESYLPVSGKTHHNNARGDIVQVGRHLAQTLEEKHGIRALHSDTIHDHYPFRDSYQRSLETVRQYLARHPGLEVIVDLHRDATPGLEHRVNIKGKTAAKIIIVVGTDRLGLSHPTWEKNYQFAMELVDAMNRTYPGLAHRVILADARYNQHLHERAVLVEVGNEKSTMEEALYAVELFAEILAAYLETSSLQSFSL